MSENRNMILAIALSALVLLGWTMLSDKFLPTTPPKTEKVESGAAKPAAQPQAGPVAATAPQKMQARSQVLAQTPRVQIRTPNLQGSINLKGARFDDLVLLKRIYDQVCAERGRPRQP